jgi:hypothetical protein
VKTIKIINVTSKEKPGEYEYLSLTKHEAPEEIEINEKSYDLFPTKKILNNDLFIISKTTKEEQYNLVLTKLYATTSENKNKLIGTDLAVVPDNGKIYHYDIHPKTKKILFTERVWDSICSKSLEPQYHYEQIEETLYQGYGNASTTEMMEEDKKYFPWLKPGDECPATYETFKEGIYEIKSYIKERKSAAKRGDISEDAVESISDFTIARVLNGRNTTYEDYWSDYQEY